MTCVAQGAGWLAAFLRSLWSGGQALISVFSLLVVTPVVAFYLLCDWDRVIATVDSWIPLPYRDTVRGLAREIDASDRRASCAGRPAVCLILGSFYAVGLTLIGLNFGLLIGLMSGIISFIPYVGSMTGLWSLAIASRLRSSGRTGPGSHACSASFMFGQFVEGNMLSPKLVGIASVCIRSG